MIVTHNPLVHGSSPCGPTTFQSRAMRGFFICAGHQVCPTAVALECRLLPQLANNQIAYKQQERFLDSLS